MDVATTLPEDIWLRIFDLLSRRDIRAMMKVNRVLYAYSCPFIWRHLTLCTLYPTEQTKAKAILRNTLLGHHIREIRLQPQTYILHGSGRWEKPLDVPTNVWVADPPIKTRLDLLKRIRWRHPILSIQHFRHSTRVVSTTFNLLPHLTHLRTLTVSTWGCEGIHLNPELYHGLWSKLQTNHLTTFVFSCPSFRSLLFFSELMKKSQTKFPCLTTLDMNSFVEHLDDGELKSFEEAIKIIASAGRNTLESLRLYQQKNPRLTLSPMMSSLGFFPNLGHFDLAGWYLNRHRNDTPVAEFLLLHHLSLKRLRLSGHMQPVFPHPPPLGGNDGSQALRNLVSLELAYDFKEALVWPTGQPSLRPHADTLTSLAINVLPSIAEPDHGFTYSQINALLSSLHSPRGSPLRRLRIPITYLCPEVFDRLSNLLDNLDTLDILYGFLVARVNSEKVEPAMFWQGMAEKSYPDWKLKWLYVGLIRCGSQLVFGERDIMHDAIPSLEGFNDRDSWDVQIKIDSEIW